MSAQVICLPGRLELDLDLAASVGPAPSAAGFYRHLDRPLEWERRLGMDPSVTSCCMSAGGARGLTRPDAATKVLCSKLSL
ncbi:hypothetical protein HPB50_006633 [Hyalomma asiaticum]|uniref:Uncharacterized protein n=1 Tax=Hyalomma asiaticum TaxID=266040 RepID=A0ACB7T8A7_HYAAI|nr:hypothetical protein HPB50_006633 [Hyalomma asiaticum]